ncbi:hypothetical protein HII31_09525 [Pseudocercospora fuligena]|uniref:F-box domain-containing protein n=1 Tax=Pseudocercospora fuligena TaxID=685502 RepID=A0A8H6VE90_9PEZI|nr:hypothetical protein HII31_09525 [Pseudocercospora fuligena]
MSTQQDINMTAASSQVVATMVPAATSKIHIFDLPVETKLQILSKLPAKEIQRARRISKHFPDLTDNPRNHTMLIAPIESRALQTIRDTFDHIVGFDPDKVDLFELIVRVSGHRAGLGAPMGPFECADVVGELLVHAKSGLDQIQWNDANHSILDLLDIEEAHHWQHFQTRHLALPPDHLNHRMAYHGRYARIGVTEALHQQWMTEIASKPQFDLQRGKRQGFAPLMVTPSPEEHNILEAAFGLPIVPEALHMVIHYCVRSAWADEKVTEALNLGAKFKMTALEKAAIMEDIYLLAGDEWSFSSLPSLDLDSDSDADWETTDEEAESDSDWEIEESDSESGS